MTTTKTLGPKHLAALCALAAGQPLKCGRGVKGLWLRGLADFAADGQTMVITDAGRLALDEPELWADLAGE